MTIEINRNDNNVDVRIIGRLDTLASVDFNTKMQGFLSEKSLNLIIDCTDLEYIASSGLRTLLSLYKSFQDNGSTMKLINVQAVVMQVFKMSGFSTFLNIE